MSEPSRPVVYLGMLLLGILFFGNIWMLQDYWTYRSRMTDAVDRYDQCKLQIADIRRLENQPRMASLTEETADDIGKRVNAACDAVGVSLQTVQPGAVNREPNSSYSRRNTTIVLNNVTLPQLIQFADKVEDVDAGLSIRDLTLTSAGGLNTGPETWNVNLTLTQLIFSPKS